MSVTTVTVLARLSNVSSPVSAEMRIAAMTTTTALETRRISNLVAGFGAPLGIELSVRPRMATYWMRPAPMPIAASAKPQWKFVASHSALVSSGPSRPPILTPM